MTSDLLNKQQSSHQDQKSKSSESSDASLPFNPNQRDGLARRERLYTFKAIPMTNEDDHSNWEPREQAKEYRTPERKVSPAFLVKHDFDHQVSDMEMEETPGLMQSVSAAPWPPIESTRDIQCIRSSDRLFASVSHGRKESEEFNTPKLPTVKNSFKNAIKFIESKTNKPLVRSTFELRYEKSVSWTDTNDSRIIPLGRKKSKINNTKPIKESVHESEGIQTPLLDPKEEEDIQNGGDDQSSVDLSFTNFVQGLKANRPPNNQSDNYKRSALPLSKSALSYDFLPIDCYISPHDISISMGLEIERTKHK